MTDPAGSTTETARRYAQMFLIRRFEETLLEMFSEGKLVGTTHTCIGQEANAVGVVGALEPSRDIVFSNHRCHGHYLAFTDDVGGLLCEVMGREGGTCGGKGGSQHLCNGNFYSNGVQGSIVPVATGMALAEREKASGAVACVFLGDGTLGQGAVYECLNMASIWSLPLLAVVENNFYAQSTPSHLTLAGSIAARAEAFDIETRQLEDNGRRADRRGRTRSRRANQRDAATVLSRARHLPVQPAQQGRRQSRRSRDRGAPKGRSAADRRRAADR